MGALQRVALGAALTTSALWTPSAAVAASQTDFGVRVVPGSGPPMGHVASSPVEGAGRPLLQHGRAPRLGSAIAMARAWGRVTSTLRTPSRNRAVGGVRNSYHLSGRAIDIARRPGVRHGDIAAAFRQAGYQLIESLDEGDHSHFAFGWGTPALQKAKVPVHAPRSQTAEVTRWRVVSLPTGLR